MHRVFVSQDQLPTITGSDVHYIKDVLRLQAGDKLELLDGTGKVYLSKIIEIKADKIFCEIVETRQLATGDPSASLGAGRRLVTIAQCLPKAKKMSLIIQKCTELGAARLIPALSERSIAKGDKRERWQKIAKEAAEQSGRSTIPRIDQLTKFKDVLKIAKNFDLALIPWELEKTNTLKKALRSLTTPHHPSPSPTILILIGPEGGFSQEEVDLARQAGFTPITLGQSILRTETAGLAVLAMINYEFDQ